VVADFLAMIFKAAYFPAMNFLTVRFLALCFWDSEKIASLVISVG
jgi:hypothetical protein